MTRFYLTTAIDYVNSRPHLGTAYEKIAADVIARYKRLAGFETHFVMGNDEHSQNVFRKAQRARRGAAGVLRPDGAEFLDVWRRLDISFDDFIRTTEPRHRAGVQELVRRMTRRRATSTKGTTKAGTACRARRSSRRRISSTGLCPIHRTKPDWIREKNYFFRLSKYQRAAARALRGAPGLPRARHPPQRDSPADRGGPRRHLGQPRRAVLGHPDAATIRRASIYVWFDALINYITAVGFGTDEALFATWWPADLHVIGKDITRFHCRHLAGDADERRACRCRGRSSATAGCTSRARR